ncbi:hypothetical protein D9758_000189 [Tetrapyrgos nigripes]|uniref:Uncharacterized protein n=1 Tax=Tetrapyrgos nigripes TaxID=182062 RepID=A0A8H5H2J3_9AGAR|nr:hypothetical protein D9758_000189 [Tetrapyrgos nigripes]
MIGAEGVDWGSLNDNRAQNYDVQRSLLQLIFSARYSPADISRLLQQERDAGTISHKDALLTTAIISFNQSLNTYVPVTTATFAGLAYFATRGRPISLPARCLGIAAAASFGPVLPSAVGAFKHRSYVQQLDNPPSVVQALKNIRENARLPVSREPDFSIDVPFESSPKNADSIPSEVSRQPQPTAKANTMETQKQSHRWDEIRSVNSNKAPASSWDALRQKHERNQIPPTAGSPPQTDADQDRVQAQAEFDAMVDRERNMK